MKADFLTSCRLHGLPDPVPEHRFHPVRRWRFDWAWPGPKIAVEIEGGIFAASGGRHNRGAGMREDMRKYAEALCLGWRVLRILPEWVDSGEALVWLERLLKP